MNIDLSALRDIPVGDQVALLFMTLFGMLLLVSAAILFYTLREPDEARRERNQDIQRDLRALWIGSLVFWLAWVSGPAGATIAFGVFSFLALREFITLVRTRRGDHRSLLLAFFAALPLQYLLVGVRAFDLFTVSCRCTSSWPFRWSARWPVTPSVFWSATPRSSGASWSACTA